MTDENWGLLAAIGKRFADAVKRISYGPQAIEYHKYRKWVLSVTAAVAGIGLWYWLAKPPPYDFEVNIPTVQNGDTITGSWKIFESPSGIQTQRTGGACLIANSSDMKLSAASCSASASKPNDACNVALPGGWHGYCNLVDETCWVRPVVKPKDTNVLTDDAFCSRSIDTPVPKIWDVGIEHQAGHFPFDIDDLEPESYKQAASEARWRVIGCLNGLDPIVLLDTSGCGTGGIQLTHWGPVLDLSP